MAKEELLQFDGKVLELLPNAHFRVILENGHEIIADNLISSVCEWGALVVSFFIKAENSAELMKLNPPNLKSPDPLQASKLKLGNWTCAGCNVLGLAPRICREPLVITPPCWSRIIAGVIL